MASLDSVHQKIFRAAEHFKSLEVELAGYFGSHPTELVPERDIDPNMISLTFRAKAPIPAKLPLIVGDCLQNLRSSLDYLVWELVLSANNQPGKYNMFPICSTSDAFVDALTKRDRLLGVPVDAIAIIRQLQPYHLGKDWKKAIFAVLDELSNINKHRRVLLTSLMATQANVEAVEIDGELWASHLPTFDGNTKFGPFPVVAGKVQMDGELFASIAFDEGTVQGMEITTCLNTWMYYIREDFIPRFERFFH